MGDISGNCASKGPLSCTNQHIKCHEISEICNYLLDKQGYVIPCKGGEHLQNCKEVECNMKFKCPNYYCVPWFYVCDGKWDCPSGLDEKFCNNKRECKNMFKCKNSIICIHPHCVCDGNFDCPSNEDEFYCNLNKVICPSICECLMFAIRCLKVSISDINLTDNYPYYDIIIVKSTIFFIKTLLKFSRHVTVLKLSRNSLDVLCSILPSTNRTQMIDVGYNKIQKVNAKCFQQASHLKIVKLNNNNIFMIIEGAFKEIDKLFAVDLSHNMLTSFSVHVFCDIPNLQLLRLGENDIKVVDYNTFNILNILIIESTSYAMICISSSKTIFIVRKPWFLLCGHLLRTYGIRISSYCTFLVIISCNIMSFTQHILLSKKSIRYEAFALSILYLCVIDTPYGLYIVYLFSVDTHYR